MTNRQYSCLIASMLAMIVSVSSCCHSIELPATSNNPFDSLTTILLGYEPPPPIPPSSQPLEHAYLSTSDLDSFLKNAPTNIYPSHNAPFDLLQYNRVILYEFDGGKPYLHIIERDGNPSSVITKQRALSQVEADSLLSVLSDRSTYGGGPAACFEPHMGIVLYHDTKVVMHISVCLDCNYLSSSIPIPAMSQTVTGLPNGFSGKGNKLLRQISDRYGIFYIH